MMYPRMTVVPAEPDPKSLTYVPDRRLRTVSAAEKAIRIAEEVNAADPPAPKPKERSLFVALQTCAYRAARPNRGGRIDPRERRQWALRYRAIREYIVELNLGLAYSMIRRFKCHELDHDDLVSDALFALARAVERFDPWQGYRFSTYACTAIARAMVNRSRRGITYRQRFPFRHDVSFEMSERVDTHTELYVERLRRALDENLGDLNKLETKILCRRFPLNYQPQSTLGDIGQSVGLSKERVRQIQNNALRKLRQVLDADPVLR
ncbi:MAG: sigma-70 family RNA polymerase sigma factor [Phycisphaerae bacterium]|nr:sigma-70 family RNA polymerase sigma factor [Phycisphaerae bacterium]